MTYYKKGKNGYTLYFTGKGLMKDKPHVNRSNAAHKRLEDRYDKLFSSNPKEIYDIKAEYHNAVRLLQSQGNTKLTKAHKRDVWKEIINERKKDY